MLPDVAANHADCYFKLQDESGDARNLGGQTEDSISPDFEMLTQVLAIANIYRTQNGVYV